jgi:hypothetical protein
MSQVRDYVLNQSLVKGLEVCILLDLKKAVCTLGFGIFDTCLLQLRDQSSERVP